MLSLLFSTTRILCLACKRFQTLLRTSHFQGPLKWEISISVHLIFFGLEFSESKKKRVKFCIPIGFRPAAVPCNVMRSAQVKHKHTLMHLPCCSCHKKAIFRLQNCDFAMATIGSPIATQDVFLCKDNRKRSFSWSPHVFIVDPLFFRHWNLNG